MPHVSAAFNTIILCFQFDLRTKSSVRLCVDDTDSSVSEVVRQEEEESGQTHSNSGGEKNKIAPFPDLFTY